MTSDYEPIYDIPATVTRYVSGITITNAAERIIREVLSESDLDRPIPAIMCGSHPDDPEKHDFKFCIFELAQLAHVVESLNTAPNYMSKIGNLDYLLIEAHHLEKADISKIDHRDGHFVFE